MKTIGKKNDFFEVFPLIYNHMGVSLRWFFWTKCCCCLGGYFVIGFSVKIARVFNAVGVEKSQVENKICGPDIVFVWKFSKS